MHGSHYRHVLWHYHITNVTHSRTMSLTIILSTNTYWPPTMWQVPTRPDTGIQRWVKNIYLALKSWLSCYLERHCQLSKACSLSSQTQKAFPCNCCSTFNSPDYIRKSQFSSSRNTSDCSCFINPLSQGLFFHFDLGDYLKWLINTTVRKIYYYHNSCTLSGISKFSQTSSWFGFNFDFIF